MDLYREWCLKLNSRKGFMVPITQFDKIIKDVYDPGYSGIYAYHEEDAKTILAQKCSKGFERFSAVSDTLPIDLDDGDSSLDEVLDTLKGYKYDLWFSGGKGYHIILHHDIQDSVDLPYSHRKWVEDRDIKCDLSLYQHSRIFSLPGRVHPKTKKKKHLIKQVEGDLITIDLVKKPEIEFKFEEGGFEDLHVALLNLANMAIKEPYVGSRHLHYWGVSKDLLRAGFPIEAIEQFMLRINESWDNPKTEEEVIAAVHQATRI